MTDIEIAQAHEMKKIVDVAAKAGIDEKHLELYGNYKAKLDLSEIRKLPRKAKNGPFYHYLFWLTVAFV